VFDVLVHYIDLKTICTVKFWGVSFIMKIALVHKNKLESYSSESIFYSDANSDGILHGYEVMRA